MKTVIACKWARDPEALRVMPDGTVDVKGAKLVASDDDAAACAAARAVGGTDLVALTFGQGDLAWAAARGAASTVVVTDAEPSADSAATAAVLAAGVRHIGDVQAVVVADTPWDRTVGVSLGAQLGWTTIGDVLTAEEADGRIRATRKNGSGTQVVDVATPAVIAVVARRAEERPPGMKDVLAARKKPVQKVTLADLGVGTDPTVVSQGTHFPDTTPARVFDGSDPAKAAADLVVALRAEGIL